MKKQSIQLNNEEIRLQSLSKSKTEKVLQKWASEEGEIQEEDIRKAASNYARLEINNRILKWIIVVVIVFLFVLLGFMIASVVIGVNITKDITVKNGALVTNSGNNTIIKTSNMKYKSKITLTSPLEVVDSMRTISLTINEGLYSAIVQFDVVSYVFIPGKQLTFYGHTHMANIMADGTVKYQLLIPFDGVKRDGEEGEAGGANGIHDNTGANTDIPITSCEEFKNKINADPNGNFILANDFSCQFTSPVVALFSGNINGGFRTLTISGTSPIFTTLTGSISFLNIIGQLSVSGEFCSVIAEKFQGRARVSKVGITNKFQLNCLNGGPNTIAGLFSATASSDNGDSPSIYTSVSQGSITFTNSAAFAAGFVGQQLSTSSIVLFRYSTSDTKYIPSSASNPISNIARFSNLQNGNRDNQETNRCLYDTTSFNNNQYTPFEDCDKNLPENINFSNNVNCDGVACFPKVGVTTGYVYPTPDYVSCSQ